MNLLPTSYDCKGSVNQRNVNHSLVREGTLCKAVDRGGKTHYN